MELSDLIFWTAALLAIAHRGARPSGRYRLEISGQLVDRVRHRVERL